jgi:hypothetical protein
MHTSGSLKSKVDSIQCKINLTFGKGVIYGESAESSDA